MRSAAVVVFRHRRRRPEVVVGFVRRPGRRRPKSATTTTTTAAARIIGGQAAAAAAAATSTTTAVARHRGGRGRRSADFVDGRRPLADGPRDRRLPVTDIIVWRPIGHEHELAQGCHDHGGGVVIVGARHRPEAQEKPAAQERDERR